MIYRELNEIEYLNWSLGQPYNIVNWIQIRGNITFSAIPIALRKLQQRHPLLNVNISRDVLGIPHFFDSNIREIPFQVRNRTSDEEGKVIFHQELITPFEMGEKCQLPLIRVILNYSPEKSDLFFSMQHVVTDGLSMVFLFRDFLTFLLDPDQEIQRNDIPAQDIDLIPPKIRKSIPTTKTRFHILEKIVHMTLKFKKKSANPIRDSSDFSTQSWTLTREETQNLIKTAKNKGVTIHTALCTAFLPEFPQINNPVNLRNRLTVPIGDAVGMFAGGAVVSLKYNPRKGFWYNARRYQKKLLFKMRDSQVFSIFKIICKAISLEEIQDFGNKFLATQTETIPFAITNLGVLDKILSLQESPSFQIENFTGAVLGSMSTVSLSVFTLQSQMHLNIHYFVSDLSKEKAAMIVTEAITRLKTAINE